MSTHNIGFYQDLTKIIFELSSNMHLISSADGGYSNTIGTTCAVNRASPAVDQVHRQPYSLCRQPMSPVPIYQAQSKAVALG